MHLCFMSTKTLLAILLSISMGGECLAGGTPFSMEVVSGWGGPVSGIQFVGNTAFIGAGRRLVALDMSNPADITELDSIDLFSTVQDVVVRDGLAYVSTHTTLPGHPPFSVLNISNPRQMTIVGQGGGGEISNPDGRVQIHGNRVYVGMTGYFRGMDISNPANPVEVPPGFLGDAFKIVGDRMYTATVHGSAAGFVLRVFNLSTTPPVSTQVGILDVTFNATSQFGEVLPDIDVEGNYAYVTIRIDGVYRLVVIDISNPRNLSMTGWTDQIADSPHVLASISVESGYAYVAAHWEFAQATTTPLPDPFRGIAIVDVATNPSAPTVVAQYQTHGTVRAVQVFGNRAYLFDDGEGLIVLDVTNPLVPVRLGHYHSPAWVRNMVKVGNLLYVCDIWNGFTILDVSDPHSTPQVVGIYQTPFDIPNGNRAIVNWDVRVRDNKAYLSAGFWGLQIVDVSNPAEPTLIGGYMITDTCSDYRFRAMDLAQQGDDLFAYVWYYKHQICDLPEKLILRLNVTDPQNTSIAGSVPMQFGDGQRVLVDEADAVAFAVRDHSSGVGPFTVSIAPTSANPSVILSSGLPQGAVELALDGNRLYGVATESVDRGLFICDVTNPASPVLLGQVDQNDPQGHMHRASSVAVENDRAYVSCGMSLPEPGGGFGGGYYRVACYDVTDPATPIRLGQVLAGNDKRSCLLAEEPYVYVTTFSGDAWIIDEGLTIIRINGIPAPCPADINDDHTVNIDDLVMIITSWGPCLGPPPAPLTVGGPGSGPGSGDMNCDFATNTFDINPFMLALNDWEQYIEDYPDCDLFNGDMNNSGFPIDEADLTIFCPLAGGVLSGGQCLVPVACPADTNGDHVINIDDLVMIITSWGSCE